MKIGQVTFFRPINYGAVLQAYAMQKVLDHYFHCDAELIDYRLPRIEHYRKLVRWSEYSNLARHPYSLVKRVGGDIVFYGVKKRQRDGFDRFIAEKLKVSHASYRTHDELRQGAQGYDAYLVGSDLVWSPEMSGGLDATYFLDFAETGTKKIAYAPSIGIQQLSEDEKTRFRRFLQTMTRLSVREESAAEILQPLTEKTITTVIDPSLLTSMDDWKDDLGNSRVKDQKYIVSFMLEPSQSLTDTVSALADKENLPIVSFDLRPAYGDRKVLSVFDAAPDEFLSIIKNASYVVTNSFHGCTFSILFHRNFWCIPHSLRGTRMIELLTKIGLENRIVTHKIDDLTEPIAYSAVEQKLSSFRMASLNYLAEALGVYHEIM